MVQESVTPRNNKGYGFRASWLSGLALAESEAQQTAKQDMSNM